MLGIGLGFVKSVILIDSFVYLSSSDVLMGFFNDAMKEKERESCERVGNSTDVMYCCRCIVIFEKMSHTKKILADERLAERSYPRQIRRALK